MNDRPIIKNADLVGRVAELALSLLEKNGVLVPFCLAIDAAGGDIIYSPETNDPDDVSFKKVEEYQREIVLGAIRQRKLVALAFCKNVKISFDSASPSDALRIEVHHASERSWIYYFPYLLLDGVAKISAQYGKAVEAVQMWN